MNCKIRKLIFLRVVLIVWDPKPAIQSPLQSQDFFGINGVKLVIAFGFWMEQQNGEQTILVDGFNGYKVYAQEASNLSITLGELWRTLKAWPYVQLKPAASPLGLFSLKQTDSKMKENFLSKRYHNKLSISI